jgi:acyl-CoA synthetase (NDP forming)
MKAKEKNFWQPLFHPRSVAVVGASRDPKKWGFNLLFNIIKGGYRGSIFPVNPREKEILGYPVYPNMAQIPHPVDLAILVVPPADILKVLEDCGRNGTKTGIVITAGFGEVGAQGKALQEEMAILARRLGMLLIGPNCQGIVSTEGASLFAHMPPQFPPPGPLGVVSQSGNLATSFIAAGEAMGIGFSRIISSGNEADLRTADFLEFLAEDPQTEVILSYIEGVKDGRAFMAKAEEVSRKKPLLVLKAGQTEAGVRAAFSHTGALSGADDRFTALLAQTGAMRGETIEEMIDVAAALISQPLPKGRKVGVVTLGGGWGVLAADYCAKAGLIVEDLPLKMVRSLNEVLPPWWNRLNPVDMVAGYRKGDLLTTLELFLRSDRFDGVLMLGLGWRTVRGNVLIADARSPEDGMAAAGQDWIEEEKKIFADVQELGRKYDKPILLASDVIRDIPSLGESVRNRRVAAYPTLSRAVKAYWALVRRYEIVKGFEDSKGRESKP